MRVWCKITQATVRLIRCRRVRVPKLLSSTLRVQGAKPHFSFYLAEGQIQMTVRELIQELEKFPKDTLVKVNCDDPEIRFVE